MKKHNRVLIRGDRYLPPSSWELEHNELLDYALYTKIEDSVYRINYINKSEGIIKYDCLTTTDIQPNINYLNFILSNIIENNNCLNIDEKDCWKFIRRYL